FCGWRPPWLMDDDRVWLLPSAKKAIEVGVVMKRVSADGIDQPDVRKANAPSVVVQLGARVEKHFCNPPDRYVVFDRISAERQGRARKVVRQRHCDAADGAQTEAESAPGQADLAQHRCEDHRHPDRLLAVHGALNGPTGRDERSGRSHPPSQILDIVGIDLGDCGSPGGTLRLSVGMAEQVAFKTGVPGTVAIYEIPRVKFLRRQSMGETQHQCDVGIRPDGHPLAAHGIRRITSRWTDRDDLDTGRTRLGDPISRLMQTRSAGIDLRVLWMRAAEHHEQSRVLDDQRPWHGLMRNVRTADDIGHDVKRGAKAVIAELVDITAAHAEKALEHAR